MKLHTPFARRSQRASPSPRLRVTLLSNCLPAVMCKYGACVTEQLDLSVLRLAEQEGKHSHTSVSCSERLNKCCYSFLLDSRKLAQLLPVREDTAHHSLSECIALSPFTFHCCHSRFSHVTVSNLVVFQALHHHGREIDLSKGNPGSCSVSKLCISLMKIGLYFILASLTAPAAVQFSYILCVITNKILELPSSVGLFGDHTQQFSGHTPGYLGCP